MASSLTVTHRSIPMGPYKLRPVCDLVRGLRVADAIVRLKLTTRAAAAVLASKLQSTASAAIDHSMNPDQLVIRTIYADQQLELKRQRIRSRGRSAIMRKRSSMVTIELIEAPVALSRNGARKSAEKKPKIQTVVPRRSVNSSAVA